MIVKAHTGSELAGDNLSKGDLAEERVCKGLEDESCGFAVSVNVCLGNDVDDVLKNFLDSFALDC